MSTWNENLPVMQVRIARPTTQLKKVVEFYERGIGLRRIGEFHNHAGYSGVMLGLPNADYHIEFTENSYADNKLPKPDEDALLVFYIPDKETIGRLVVKLGALGYFPVAPANPYWEYNAVTIEDPDGWRVVFAEQEGLG